MNEIGQKQEFDVCSISKALPTKLRNDTDTKAEFNVLERCLKIF